jgi:hypothetical protein
MNFILLKYLIIFLIIYNLFLKIKFSKKKFKLEDNIIVIENWYDCKKCAYSSTWDDSHIRVKLDKLSQDYNIPLTLYVTSMCLRKKKFKNHYIKLSNNNNEISDHTYNHTDLIFIDFPEMKKNLLKSRKIILDNKLIKEHDMGIAYTFGLFPINKKKLEFIKKKYLYARGITTDLENKSPLNLYDLNVIPVGSIPFHLQNKFNNIVDYLNFNLKKCIIENKLMITYGHNLEYSGWEPICYKAIKSHFDFVKNNKKKIWCAKLCDIIKYIKIRNNVTIKKYKKNSIKLHNKYYYKMKITLSFKNLPGKIIFNNKKINFFKKPKYYINIILNPGDNYLMIYK